MGLDKIEKNKERSREWYLKNRNNKLVKSKEYVKKMNYKYEKTLGQRFIRNIKRQTRYYFPLNNHYCEFCGEKAVEHHHNTFPIEFDKFNYICKKCHKRIEGKI